MGHARREPMALPESPTRSVAARLGLLVDREGTERSQRRLATRLRQAQLRQSACLEDRDARAPRGLDQAWMLALATCQGSRDHRHVRIVGPTGVGNTWGACALGHQACRHGWTTLSLRVPRGLQARPIAKGDGRSPPLLAAFAKTERLLLDDWGLVPCSAEHRRDILERLEERHGRRATMITRQFPVDHWHEAMGDPTVSYCLLL
jgi:DNA replication protein DnaC